MNYQKIRKEVMRRSQNDPWCRECLADIQKYEEAFLAIREKLSESEREQLDLYIGSCEAWCESRMFVAFELGQEVLCKRAGHTPG